MKTISWKLFSFVLFFKKSQPAATFHAQNPKKVVIIAAELAVLKTAQRPIPRGPLETGMTGPTAVPPWVFSRIPKFEDAAQHAGKSEDSSEPGQKPYIEKAVSK